MDIKQALVIEDDQKISTMLERGLSESHFVVDHVANGQVGLELALTKSYNVIVIDLMLSKKDGLSIIKELRKQKNTTPVIVLGAKHSLNDLVKCLEIGGDDYLIKPFAFLELKARIQALLRRSKKSVEQTKLSIYDLNINFLTREVFRSGQKIELQHREFLLLEYFVKNQNRIISRTRLFEKVWNYNFDPQSNVIEVLVCRLRNKIDKDSDKKFIQTVRGVGYVFKNP